jgi:hypothetical protein
LDEGSYTNQIRCFHIISFVALLTVLHDILLHERLTNNFLFDYRLLETVSIAQSYKRDLDTRRTPLYLQPSDLSRRTAYHPAQNPSATKCNRAPSTFPTSKHHAHDPSQHIPASRTDSRTTPTSSPHVGLCGLLSEAGYLSWAGSATRSSACYASAEWNYPFVAALCGTWLRWNVGGDVVQRWAM